jgi:hypothetical protein
MGLLAAYRAAIAARESEQEALVRLMRGRADVEAAVGLDFEVIAGAVAGKASAGQGD